MSSKPERAEPQVPDEVQVPKDLAEQVIRGDIQLSQFLGLSRERLYEYAAAGHGMLQAGRTRLALDIFEGLVAAAPKDPVFLTQLGATYLTLERLDDAFGAYDRALKLLGTHVDALVGRGEVHLRRGNIPEGLRDLSRAIECDPGLEKRSTQRARSTLLGLKKQADQIKAARPGSTSRK
ncbi:tetratricopeptide repeat protein [Myxococcus sp. K15C18031901]|uniref:tetratricopeptide repeat protein n=1 Tax=Myxococcus dinghuensis TaxID=2906761 RepID=UPI0020A7DBEB|nr:tetratricopeptide repeat protein [Myxococcus dinghuensis]MCP3097634.1 tetratricopeptide repeat protein [Myxococcus dinghuensis]